MAPDPGLGAAEEHHSELWAELTERGHGFINLVARHAEAEAARRHLVRYLEDEVVPHLEAERRAVYTIARHAGFDALVDAMELDHRGLVRQAQQIMAAPDLFEAALATRGFLLLFALRMEKEEQLLLPGLAAAGIDITELLRGRSDIVGPEAG